MITVSNISPFDLRVPIQKNLPTSLRNTLIVNNLQPKTTRSTLAIDSEMFHKSIRMHLQDLSLGWVVLGRIYGML